MNGKPSSTSNYDLQGDMEADDSHLDPRIYVITFTFDIFKMLGLSLLRFERLSRMCCWDI